MSYLHRVIIKKLNYEYLRATIITILRVQILANFGNSGFSGY